MRVPFRQGIVSAPANFLTLTQDRVTITVPTNEHAVITLSDGDTNYTITERDSIHAWLGPFTAPNYWLYWDIDTVTGEKTYGKTTLDPVDGPDAPANPTDGQMWYNTTKNTMFEFNGRSNTWQRRVRVFAAAVFQGGSLVSMSSQSPLFTGTQVGSTEAVTAGALVFDGRGKVITKSDGTFFTTEDAVSTGIGSNARIKLETITLTGKAATSISAYSLVRFTDFNTVSLATNMMADAGMYGIVERNAVVGDIVTIVHEGIITNPDWNWPANGGHINSPLFVTSTGQLTVTAQPSRAVGVVIAPDTALLTSMSVNAPSAVEAAVTITGPTSGVTVTGQTGPLSSSFSIALSGNLLNVESVQSSGIVSRDATGTWSAGNIDLSTDSSGVLSAANGGTGLANPIGYIKLGNIGGTSASPTIPGSDISGNITGSSANVSGIVAIANGGTGATVKAEALAALLPDQLGMAGKALMTNGLSASWQDTPAGTVTAVSITTTTPGISAISSPVAADGSAVVNVDLTGNVKQLGEIANEGIIVRNSMGVVGASPMSSPSGSVIVGDYNNITIDLPVISNGGTFTAVTTDVYGRVVSGSTIMEWSALTGTPTTLAGYGITDAYTKAQTDAKTWNWSAVNATPTTITGYGIADAIRNGGGVTTITADAAINKPPYGTPGRVFIDTTTNAMSYDSGSAWVAIGNGSSVTAAFTNSDLVAGIFTFTHNINDPFPFVQLYDDVDTITTLPAIKIIATSPSTITIDFNGSALLPLTGTWHVKVRS